MMFRRPGLLVALAFAACSSSIAVAAPDPGGGAAMAEALIVATPAAVEQKESGVADVVIGIVFIAGIGFVAYTIWKKKQAKKAARAASGGSTTVRPPNSG